MLECKIVVGCVVGRNVELFDLCNLVVDTVDVGGFVLRVKSRMYADENVVDRVGNGVVAVAVVVDDVVLAESRFLS